MAVAAALGTAVGDTAGAHAWGGRWVGRSALCRLPTYTHSPTQRAHTRTAIGIRLTRAAKGCPGRPNTRMPIMEQPAAFFVNSLRHTLPCTVCRRPPTNHVHLPTAPRRPLPLQLCRDRGYNVSESETELTQEAFNSKYGTTPRCVALGWVCVCAQECFLHNS